MDTAELKNLTSEWREQADQIEPLGAEDVVTTLRTCAEDLDERLARWRREPLTPEQGAVESGYSENHLRRLVRDGKIPNAGEENRPRIRRRDLPRKPGGGSTVMREDGEEDDRSLSSRMQVVRSVVNS